MNDPKISVIVTCFNEENNIGECLDSLLGQRYPAAAYEVIVSDGDSKDGTKEIVKSYEHKDQRIKLVVEPKKGTAAGRNAGIRAAGYDHVAFIDADCEAPSDWLAILAGGWLKYQKVFPALSGVGGANLPPAKSSTRFLQAVGLALNSFFGSMGSVQGKIYPQDKQVDSISTCNALYSKTALIKVGMFDESLGSEAEDAELNYRMKASNYSFVFLHESFVWHKMRVDPKSWARNMFRYGKGRARLIKRHPEMLISRYIVPAAFLPVLSLPLLYSLNNWFLLPLIYFPAIALSALPVIFRTRKPGFFLLVILVYLSTHLAYSSGMLFGFVNSKVK